MVLGPVMLDVGGTALEEADRRRLRAPAAGGVILFSRNYESPEQIRALVEEIHALREPRLLVAVDHEGGRVQRFREGFTRLPPMAELGLAWDADPGRALELAERTGWLLAAELRAVGVDFSFAPVLDLDRGVCAVIGDRAFHRDPETVAELAGALQRGMRAAGMQAVGKHFPGHGGVAEDSHLELPVDDRPLADIELADLVPFERLIHRGIAGIMPAHVVYRQVDSRPAGYSAFWIGEVLRDRLGFQGAVFSDDLSMAAAEVAGGPAERARAALAAGCDMVLVCNDPGAADEVLEALARHEDPAAQARLARLHGRGGTDWQALRASESWRLAVEAVRSYDVDPLLDMDM